MRGGNEYCIPTVAERFANLLLVGLTATAVPLPPGRGCRQRKRRLTGLAAQLLHADVEHLSQTQICYRPEDVVLATACHTDHPGRYTATVQQIVYTVPLARITLGPAPTITALVHRRDVYRLDLRMGGTVEVLLPPTAIRLWPAANP